MTLQEMAPQEKLNQYRGSIDNLDAALIHIMAERFRVTKAVGELKAAHDFPPSDPKREQRQAKRLRELAEASNLDPDFAEKLLNFIISEVIQHHKQARK
ncbi:MAG: chorismate mutase [Pseudomonadota bacterium]